MSSVNTQPVCDMPISDEEHELLALRNEFSEFKRDILELRDLVKRLEALLLGDGGKFGIAQKVQVVWRAWVWLLCTLSAIAGYALHAAVPWIKP